MEDKLLTLKKAADLLGVSTETLRRWDAKGVLRVARTPHGKRRVPLSEVRRLQGGAAVASRPRVACLYARVSSREQKAKGDLDRQLEYLRSHLPATIFERVMEIADVGSGLSDKRKGLLQLMEIARQGEATDIVITFKDRLTRFGFGYLERYFAAFGVQIHVVDGVEDRKSLQEELVEDLLAIVTSFSGKLYGLRSHRKARELVAKVKEAVARDGDL